MYFVNRVRSIPNLRSTWAYLGVQTPFYTDLCLPLFPHVLVRIWVKENKLRPLRQLSGLWSLDTLVS